jgi:UPF0042 nucleotide-binding protein
MRGAVAPEWTDADVRLPVRRLLRNPFKVAEYRDLCGLDQAVQDYVSAQPRWHELREDALTQVRDRLAEGQCVITVAVMCSGGHDRSVAVAELLAAELRGWDGVDAYTRHLHLYRRHPWVPARERLGR